MDLRVLGRSGIQVSPIGLGTVKIGRNQGLKYPQPFQIPDFETASRFLNVALDLGVKLIDTAPAYGCSEERIGRAIGHRRHEYALCTKAGEFFERGASRYDFSKDSIGASVERSLERLRTDRIDIVLIHSNGEDEKILRQTDALETLCDLKGQGKVGAVGLSAKSAEGAMISIPQVDVLMIEYNKLHPESAEVIRHACSSGVGVLLKKVLGSGRLAVGDPLGDTAAEALEFVFASTEFHSAVIGTLQVDHLRTAIEVFERATQHRNPAV